MFRYETPIHTELIKSQQILYFNAEYNYTCSMEAQMKNQIAWTPVVSSNLVAVSYDAKQHALAVRFKASPTTYYVYADVTPEQNEAFMSADSQGSFLAREIKPNHEFKKIED